MAEISKITLPDGNDYDLKVYTNHIAPMLTKQYSGIKVTANNDASGHLYCGVIHPTSYTTQWKIKYIISASIDNVAQGFQKSIVTVTGVKSTFIAYCTYNTITNTSYRPIYGHPFYWATQTGINNNYGHTFGFRLYSSYAPSTATRNIKIEIIQAENCTIEFLNTPVVYASVPGTGSTNYRARDSFDGTTQGNTITGDRNDANYINRACYSLYKTYTATGRYKLMLTKNEEYLLPINSTDNNLTTTKTLTEESFDPFGPIYYYSYTNRAADTNFSTNELIRQQLIDLRYSFNCGGNTSPVSGTLIPRKSLYLVASPQLDGSAKLHSSPLTQTLPTSDNGLIYIYLGQVYADTDPYRIELSINHPIYWYKNGAIRPYIQVASQADTATTATKLNSTRSFTIGKTAKNVDWSGAVSFSQAEISDNASTSAAGWMSKDDKTKLNGIETGAQVNTITGVKGGSESSYRTGNVNITATNIGLGNVTNNKQVKGLSSGTTNNNLVAWGSDGYTVADSGIAKGSVATKLALSGTNYSASSNTITVTKANLQSAVQDSSLVLMTAAERTKLASIDTSGNYVTVGGTQTVTGAKTFSALTSFTDSVTMGYGLSATGSNSVAMGANSTASGDYAHAEGCNTIASGQGAHAQGEYSKASGEGAHAQGWLTYAIGDYSHASGLGTFATSNYQTVIGQYNYRTVDNSGDEPIFDAGNYAFIIGNGTITSRSNALTVDWDGSVASGNDVTASGESSIATGRETVASGFYSHAEGLYSVASSTCSHASGEGTYATAANQTTIGKYNAVTIDSTFDPPLYDAGSDFALIIGNGTSNNNRSNALTVYWDGTTKSFGHFLSQQSGITIGTTPSSSQYLRAFGLMDSTGYPYADIQHTYLDDGYSGMTLCVNRDVNNTTIQNFFRILIGADGTRAVRFNDAEAWRKGLGVNIKTYSVTLTTNQYGEINIPSAVSSKTILTVKANAYNYGVFLNTRLRVYNVEGTNPVIAASKSIPLVFIYID